jgi:hypothetical protein
MAAFPTSRALPTEVSGNGVMVVPVSLASDWLNVTSGLSLATAPVYTRTSDFGTDLNLTLPGTTPFYRDQGRGSEICTRLVYDNAHSIVNTPPQYLLLGRRRGVDQTTRGASAWQFLPNKTDNAVATLLPDPDNDIKFTQGTATLRATTHRPNDNVHDTDGCDEFWLIPIRAIIATGGDVTLDRIEVKVL